MNNRRTLLKSYIWNYVVSNSGKATLENSIKGDIDLELIGGTEQLTTTGKNIFDESKAVTGRINPDNGKLLPETSYISSDYIEVQEGETYFQSGSGDGYYRAFYDMNKKFTSIPTKGVFKITVPVGSKFLRISGRKERFGDWMIEKGDKATPYEPYTGGKLSPSPEHPQEIKNAGRKSRNLFDITKLKKGAGENYPTEIELVGETLIAKKDGGTANQMTFEIELENLEPNTTYEFTTKQIICKRKDSDTEKAGTIFSFRAYKNESQIENKGNVFTTGESESDIYKILFSVIDGDFGSLEYVKFEQPMLSHSGGSYEPYSDKYKIDIKVTEKNLFDREKARDTTNWIIRDGDGYAKFPIRVGKGNKATFSYTEKLIAGKGFYLGIAQSDTGSAVGWLYHSTEINLNNNKLTVVAKGDCLYLSCNKTSIQKFFDTIQTLQVEIGSEQTVYEPYTEQTLTLTSDRPITKWDKLVEQGGQYGWLYASKKYVITGNEVFEPRSGYDQDAYTNRFIVINDLFVNRLNDKQLAYCKILKRVQYIYAQNKLEEGIDTNINQLHIKLSNDRIGVLSSDDTETRTAKIAEYIKNTYTDGIEILYATTDTVFLPLSESEQTQLRNLHSYNGTTHVFVDSGEVPCGTKVEYKQKK